MDFLNRLLAHSLPYFPKPLVRAVSAPYIAGETVEEMLAVVARLNAEGCLCTVDVLGEFIRAPSEARMAVAVYEQVLTALAAQSLQSNISVKLSQMGLLLDPSLCLDLMRQLLEKAQQTGSFVRIDMEDASCTTATIRIYRELHQNFSNVGIVLQACLRRTQTDANALMADGLGNFRLCKGIYLEPWSLAYRERGLINRNYVCVLKNMLAQGAYVGIATHDEALVYEAERLIEKYGLSTSQEGQRGQLYTSQC